MHIPVLLKEVIESLKPESGEIFVDGTINRAGHAKEIAAQLGSAGWLIGIDQDTGALKTAEENLNGVSCRVSLVQGNFRNIAKLVKEVGAEKVNGVLLDIGFSSDQIENSGRGFSFQKDEPLLMTFAAEASSQQFTAADMVNEWDEENLADVIYAYGEETFARRIAKAIVEARQQGRIETTGQLVEIVRLAVPAWYTKRKIHFATKTFQALRMTVNDELGALKECLTGSWEVLAKGGRLGVISFHSLEARIVKSFMKEKADGEDGEMVTKKAVKAGREETLSNPRSRSAQLRVIKKL